LRSLSEIKNIARRKEKMTTSKGIVNGVNVDTLFGVIDAVKENPKVADFKFSITNKWDNGGHNVSQIGNFYGAWKPRPGTVLW
jgi:hypothetical protein